MARRRELLGQRGGLRARSISPAQYAARDIASSAHSDSRSLPDNAAESTAASPARTASVSCPFIKRALASTRKSVGMMKL